MGVILVLFGLLHALAWVNGQQQDFALNETFALSGDSWRGIIAGELVQSNLIMFSNPPSSPEYALKVALSPTVSQTSSVQVSTGDDTNYSCSDGTYVYFGRWYTRHSHRQ